MFQNLSTRATLRPSAVFTAAELGTSVAGKAIKPGNQRTGGLIFTVTRTSGTAGTLGIAALQGSLDNGTTFFGLPFKVDDLTSPDVMLTTPILDGTTNIIPVGPVPEVLRLVYSPSALYDGQAEARLYSAGRILGIGQDL